MNGPNRDRVITRIADHLVAQPVDHPLRVAVDGITAAGKTTLAAEVTAAVRARGRGAEHLSTDDFQHVRARRHAKGRTSALGYYQDAYDLETFRRLVLDPLGPDGDRRYRRRSHDLATDELVDEEPVLAAPDDVFVIDGSFLLTAELASAWDEIVWVDTSFAVARDRGSRRDAAAFGGVNEAADALDQRYHAAARLYLDEVDARALASILVGNDDLDSPVLRRIGGGESAMAPLFSYGTLQLESVQLATFGRRLAGEAAVVPGHRTDWVQITDPDVIAASGTDRHPVVVDTGEPADRTAGTVLTVTTTELAAADMYEVDDYRRVRVALESGQAAWMYAARPPRRPAGVA